MCHLIRQLSIIGILISMCSVSNGQGLCTDNEGCYPPVGDLTLGRDIIVTSTCTEGDMCNSSFINDDDSSTAWASDVIPDNDDIFMPFIIEINFDSPVLFYNTTITWQSGVPRAMSIERNNGSDWIPYRYYSVSPDGCMDYYGLNDSLIRPDELFPDQEPVCTTLYEKFIGGRTVPFDTFSHLSPNDEAYEQLSIAYQLITGLRIVIDDINNDSMIDGVLSRQVSISDWTAFGTCMCNGHASTCSPVDGESMVSGKVYSGCMCGHDTAGTNCEICATGYNDQEWMPGNETDANACEACQCNGHAEDCAYDWDLMMGICIDCQDNTEGIDCSTCQDTFYPDPSLMVMSPNYCKACECDEVGSTDGICSNDGVCSCKANVVSNKCSTCRSGYWNLTQDNPYGCQPCDCEAGAEVSDGLKLCDVDTGVCECQDNVYGERCDTCIEGMYNLKEGCDRECQCNSAGAVNTSCDPIEGQCYCKDNITGIVCNAVEEGFYYKVLDDITLEAEAEYSISSSSLTLVTPLTNFEDFSGRGYLLVPSSGAAITFTDSVDISTNYFIVLRYKSDFDISGVGIMVNDNDRVNYTLLAAETSEPNEEDFNVDSTPVPVFLSADNIQHNIEVVYDPVDQQGNEWMIDSIVLLPDITTNGMYNSGSDAQCLPLSLPVERGPYCDLFTFDNSLMLNNQVFVCDDKNENGTEANLICPAHGQIYDCLPGYNGTLCYQIPNGYYRAENGSHLECANVCDSTGAFYSACNPFTGMCDCRDNVTGETCDTCALGHYGLSTNGCSDCGCYGNSQTCNQLTGECDCPSTTTGPVCDACADGYYDLTADGCTPCNCNTNGSSSITCNQVTGQCDCSGNAVGQQCSECPNGYYRVNNSTSQEYCVECFCFNHTTQCNASTDQYALVSVSTDFVDACSNPGVMDCQMDWTLENMEILSIPSSDGLFYLFQNAPDSDHIFVSPSKYHGDFRLAYGHNITIIFMLNSPLLTYENNFIRLVSPQSTIYAPFTPPITEDLKYTFEIPLLEEYWQTEKSADGSPVNTSVLVDTLSNITYFNFSGIFSDNIVVSGYLQFVSMEYISPVTNGSQNGSQNMFIAENCSCPDGHLGPFCDECAEGYYRKVDSAVEPCISCDCNGLATSCATLTGICNDCTGNSTGDDCGRCINGYYGDPKSSQPCLLCDCSGNSQTCNINGICDNCTEAYRGDHCEICANGYYEDMPGVCVPCDCNNNADTSVDPFCDPATGQCLSCTDNTNGNNCETCVTGYYINGNSCQACDCDPFGSTSEICDNSTGQCFCRTENTTSDCSRCLDGFYGNITDNETCTLCPCPVVGNSHAISCFVNHSDYEITCTCEEKYTGRLCDECAEGYFGNSLIGICNDCQCNGNADECDPTTGFCLGCINNTNGGECENCDNGYYGDPAHNIPCQLCSNCSLKGTVEEVCDMVVGNCHCKEGVIGDNCTECAVGEFGAPDLEVNCQSCSDFCENTENPECHLSEDLMTPICDNCGPNYSGSLCQYCANGFYRNSSDNTCIACSCNGNVDPKLGLVCDPNNGTCLNCLNSTMGASCEECAIGYYGDVLNGIPCQKCNCNEENAFDEICNLTTGQCSCKPFFNSTSGCGSCIPGYWGTDSCEPCDCCINGSSESTECDQTTGQCLCKDGVDGQQCCECKDGYYNLTSTGCTACNCSVSSINPSCNATGHCACNEGVTGMKCDECDFGYTGSVPNCTVCHDCFFLWNDLLSDTSRNVTTLLGEVQSLVGYYGVSTEESVTNASRMIETTIITINQTLQMMHIDEQQLTAINTTLQKVSNMHLILIQQINSLNHSLNETAHKLDEVMNFLTEMQQTELTEDLDEIHMSISNLVEMAKILQSQAMASNQTISDNQQDILMLQAIVSALSVNISADNQALQAAWSSNNVSKNLSQMAASFAMEISSVNTDLMLVEKKVDDFESKLLDEKMDMEELVEELNMLDQTLAAFNQQLLLISGLSQALENSTVAVEMQASKLLTSANTLMDSTNTILQTAELLLMQMGVAGNHTNQTAQNLTDARETAAKINQVQAPSPDEALSLASGINDTIIPEEEVAEVLKDANESSTRAKEYLQRALNTSEKVNEFEDLISSIKTDKTQANDTIGDVQEHLSTITDNVEDIDYSLKEVEKALDVSSNSEDQRRKLNDTYAGLQSGMNKLNSLKTEAQMTLEDSQKLVNDVTNESNKLQDEAETLKEININVTSDREDALEDLNVAKTEKSMADESKTEANKAPSLQDLEVLLTKYQDKVQEVIAAKEEIDRMNENLEGMVTTFNEASKKYKTCYKTP